jgi:hypothetical protein
MLNITKNFMSLKIFEVTTLESKVIIETVLIHSVSVTAVKVYSFQMLSTIENSVYQPVVL